MSASSHPKGKGNGGKDPKKVKAGQKGGKMSRARNREAIQANRKKQIFLLRLEGLTEVEIAGRLQISQSRVSELYRQAMAERLPEDAKLAQAIRERQLLKLEVAENHIFGMMQKKALKVREVKDDGDVVELADFEALHKLNASLVKNFEQAAKLAGAYKPVEVKTTGDGQIITAATLAAHLETVEKRDGRD